jgi:hypothetical protein
MEKNIPPFPSRRFYKSFLFGLVGIDYCLHDNTLLNNHFDLFVKVWFFRHVFVIKNRCKEPGTLYQKKDFEDVEIEPYVYPRSDFKVSRNWLDRGYFERIGS